MKAQLLVGASVAMLVTAQAKAQDSSPPKPANAPVPAAAAVEDPAKTGDSDIVVTGSRVITNGNKAPTPVTVASPETLAASRPSSVADGIASLPQFAQAPGIQSANTPTTNSSGTYLNLRRFGSQRNLVLLDGMRLPPTATTGAVDVNNIPQQFIKRVDIVTGGVSAVYGSDAVTGAINFILDDRFKGIKFNAQAGVSTYGDAGSYRLGIAAGTALFGGRGHFEISYDRYSTNVVPISDRPGGRDDLAVGGDGSAANPFRLVANVRAITGTPGGLIVSSTQPLLQNITFNQNGTPF